MYLQTDEATASKFGAFSSSLSDIERLRHVLRNPQIIGVKALRRRVKQRVTSSVYQGKLQHSLRGRIFVYVCVHEPLGRITRKRAISRVKQLEVIQALNP